MSDEGNELSDSVLLEICRVARDDAEFSDEFLADLRAVSRLVGTSPSPRGTRLSHAFTLLTAAVAKLPQFNPKHLPFGYDGPTIRSDGWIERETLERLGKQISGLQWSETKPDTVAFEVGLAVSEAVKVGFLDEKNYDAWRPGMESGSGWRSALSATTYGVTKARAASNGNGSKPPKPQVATRTQAFYLLTARAGAPALSRNTAFYKVTDAKVAQSLCRLFTKEHGNDGTHHFAVAPDGVSPDDQILLEETLDDLQMYDDPDPGIYDPPPTQGMMDRARFARRATTWEEMIRARSVANTPAASHHDPQESSTGDTGQRPQSPAYDDPVLEPVRNLVAALTELRAAETVVLNAADEGKAPSEAETKRFNAAQGAAAPLVAEIGPHLAALSEKPDEMAEMLDESFQALVKAIEPLVPGAGRPTSTHPVSKEVIEIARGKLVEFMMVELPLFAAVTDPKKLRPSPEEDRSSGWTLLLLLAQAYYKILESTVSTASWCTSLDLQLNHYYLWTIKNLTNLLQNHEGLRDFPGKFEPAFPDLYPSTIRDVDWEDMVAPGAEQFLSTVQSYVFSKPVLELPEGSAGWLFVETFKDSITRAVNHATEYNARMRRHIKKILGPNQSAGSPQATELAPTPDSSDRAVAVGPEGDSAPPPAKPTSENGTRKESERETAIQALLQPLIRIDHASMNFGVLMHRLREENLHGASSGARPAALTFMQIIEIKERLAAATKPIQDAVALAKPACDGIARHLSKVIDDPEKWETDLRTNLRLLGEVVCGFSLTVPSSPDEEACLNGLMAALYAQGTRLQDAYQTLEASASHDEGSEVSKRVALIQAARPPDAQLYEPARSRDPMAVWLAAETMKSIALGLMNESILVRADKPGNYEDRDKLNRDFRMAERHGYLLVSVARQLSLDPTALIRILREDRLWEYPNEKEDVAVFRAVTALAERIGVEARVWCSEAGLDPEAMLHEKQGKADHHGGNADTPTPPVHPAAGTVDPIEKGPVTSVVLGRQGEPCQVLGKPKDALTDGQYAVVAALLKAGADGMTKDALENIRPSARNILRNLRKQDPDWSTVILMPGKTNVRYRVKA